MSSGVPGLSVHTSASIRAVPIPHDMHSRPTLVRVTQARRQRYEMFVVREDQHLGAFGQLLQGRQRRL